VSHVNTQVRTALQAALEGVLKTVSTNGSIALLDVELPAGVIGTGTDQAEPFAKGPPPQELRTVALSIVLVAEGASETVDDDLDALRAQVEPLVPTALAGIARHVRHTGSDLDMGMDEDGERWLAFLALAWEVEIVTAVGDPETALL